ncbi:MAG: hypothetical protein WCF90_04220 [Methanomicrobiales archaeon]
MYTHGDVSGIPVTYQAVYYPAAIGDTHLSIFVATPENKIISAIQEFRNNLQSICGIHVISPFFFFFFFFTYIP